jgi:hypothetical protein
MKERLVDAFAGLAVDLLIESSLEPDDLLNTEVPLPLVIRSLHFHVIRSVPVYAGFLAPDRGGLPHHVVHDVEVPNGCTLGYAFMREAIEREQSGEPGPHGARNSKSADWTAGIVRVRRRAGQDLLDPCSRTAQGCARPSRRSRQDPL